MAKQVEIRLVLSVDDDAKSGEIAEWMKVVLPLRGDTGQIQHVDKVFYVIDHELSA